MKPCSHRNHVIFYNNAYLQKHVIPVINTPGVTGNMSVVYNMWASDPRWFTHHAHATFKASSIRKPVTGILFTNSYLFLQ